MATYTTDKIEFGGNIYKLQDSDALPLAGGSVTGPVNFGDSVTMEEASVGDLLITGNASATNNLQVNTLNGVEVGNNPIFTDTVTTVTTSGSGNAITAISASNGVITATKETTFLTSHQDISGKAPTNHASTATTYGIGTNNNYGHVKLSDTASGSAAAASGGTAATPKAVSDAKTAAINHVIVSATQPTSQSTGDIWVILTE